MMTKTHKFNGYILLIYLIIKFVYALLISEDNYRFVVK